ncbi:hypothetical protein HW555_009275, partial [Spodoptera exigua]
MCRRLARLEFELPRDPDQQKKEMLAITEEEHYRFISPDALERIEFYLSVSLSGKQLPEYPVELYKRARVAVDKQTECIKQRMLILTWQANVRRSEAEIREFFVMAMKRCILQYILEDGAERVRLQIPFVPPLWPAHVVRAPVPWHTPLVKAREALSHRYFLGNPVLLELRRMWHERYQNVYIVDMKKMQAEVPFPQYTHEFTENLNRLCQEMRTELEENWLIDVADTMIKMRHHWA